MNCALVLVALVSATRGADAAAAATRPAATAAGGLVELSWQTMPGESESVKLVLPGASQAVDVAKVTLPPTGGTVRVLELQRPPLTAPSWLIEGKVKYENVRGNGYLEMWSHFPDGSAYFTRTLDTSGAMGVLHGQSEWRAFKLPFFAEPGKLPSKLEVNVVLPEGGTAWLAPGTLSDGFARENLAARAASGAAAWWGPRQGGRIGGMLGTALGLYGALIGILASRGRGRRVAFSLMVAVGVACAVMLGVGIVALVGGQPYAVWYPLVLAGGLGAVLSAGLVPVMKRRFEDAEMRKMMALDA